MPRAPRNRCRIVCKSKPFPWARRALRFGEWTSNPTPPARPGISFEPVINDRGVLAISAVNVTAQVCDQPLDMSAMAIRQVRVLQRLGAQRVHRPPHLTEVLSYQDPELVQMSLPCNSGRYRPRGQ